MASEPSLFLDTSALFAGMWSSAGGARLILKLGEAGAVQLVVSSQVLAELEDTLRRKSPRLVEDVAVLLDRAQVMVSRKASPASVHTCLSLVSHPGDAHIIADAWDAGVDYFVTLDKKHFLSNTPLRAVLPFPIGTPGDFLSWYRARLQTD
jgi:predicted nucleic acid-binding protein